MAVITAVEATDVVRPTKSGDWHNTQIRRTYGESAAATIGVLTHTPNGLEKVISVEVVFSGAPTYTGTALTIKRLSDLAATAHDIQLTLGSEPADDDLVYAWYPGDTDTNGVAGEVFLASADEVLEVTVPSGGGALTSGVVITTELLS